MRGRLIERNMNWHYKALLQRGFSMVPFGEQLNYFFQRHVTKTLPTPDAKFSGILSTAEEHLVMLRRYLGRPFREAIFYEFGAGWDLMIPLALYAFGVERQILVDVRYIVRPELVNDTIHKFERVALSLGPLRKPEHLLESGHRFVSSLKEYYGIEYKAPCDARDTGLVAGSIDCITSTSTLEHIPPGDIQAILRECHRLLRDDGVMSCRIDYDDHYSYFDSRISTYNFLQYSDKQWAIFSPLLQYQNRLRHRDYLELFYGAGFETVEERRKDGTVSDRETIERLPLAKRFRVHSTAELAVHNALIVLRKRKLIIAGK